MRAARIGALLLACSLAACGHTHKVVVQQPAPPPPPVRPLVEVPGPGALPEYPVPTLRPGSESESQPSDASAASGDLAQPTESTHVSSGEETAAATATASEPVQPVDPNRLIGLTEGDAMKLLGPPAEKTESPPSRVWTYHSTACDMKLFFYPEVGGATYRSLTYQIDDRDPADEGYRGCVGSLVKTHAG